jgi:hypothetical protein
MPADREHLLETRVPIPDERPLERVYFIKIQAADVLGNMVLAAEKLKVNQIRSAGRQMLLCFLVDSAPRFFCILAFSTEEFYLVMTASACSECPGSERVEPITFGR